MKDYITYEANSLTEVQEATKNLDRSSLVKLQADDNGVMKDVTKFNGVYNNSKGECCAVVAPNYRLIQHKQYIDNFAEVLNRLNMKYKMYIKPQGNKVFADVEFEGQNHKFDKLNEEFIVGLRLVNSYDKSTGLGIMSRYKRLGCLNGMVVTRHEAVFSVKHTSKLLDELETFIEKRINYIIASSDELKTWVSNCMKDSIEWNTVCKIFEKLIVQLKHREEILKRLNISVVVKKDKAKKKTIEYVLEEDGNKTINRWDMYNAVTYHITHGEHITPHIEACYQRKAEKILLNPLKVLVE